MQSKKSVLDRKKIFITKITGNTRIEYIQKLFNNPYIIWIDRDHRLVVMSYHKQRWSYKKNIREFYNKSEEELIAEYSKMYIKYYNEKEKLKQFNYKQVFYENIVSDRYKFFQDIFEFICEKQNRAFHEIIDTWIIKKDTDEFYNNYFTNDGMILLNNLLKKPLQELGYKSVY